VTLENIRLQREAAQLKEQLRQTTLSLERSKEELSRLRQELSQSRASTRTSDPHHESNQREPRPQRASDIRSQADYELPKQLDPGAAHHCHNLQQY
jgi:hypothetical protein